MIDAEHKQRFQERLEKNATREEADVASKAFGDRVEELAQELGITDHVLVFAARTKSDVEPTTARIAMRIASGGEQSICARLAAGAFQTLAGPTMALANELHAIANGQRTTPVEPPADPDKPIKH